MLNLIPVSRNAEVCPVRTTGLQIMTINSRKRKTKYMKQPSGKQPRAGGVYTCKKRLALGEFPLFVLICFPLRGGPSQWLNLN